MFMGKVSFDLDDYKGVNRAEQALSFLHAVLTQDINAVILPAVQADGGKSLVVRLSSGECADVLVR
jgi:hypothetical protein